MSKLEIVNIGVVIKPSKFEDMSNFITNLVRWLKRRNKVVHFSATEEERLSKVLGAKVLKDIIFTTEDKLFKKTDLIISLGGDGTLLGVCRNVSNKVPVLGINLGRLGFITEFSKNEFYESLNTILLGKYENFKKNLYSLKVIRKDGSIEKANFFNDAVISKNEIARMFTLSIEADDQHIYNLSGDGLIISSTYGSTAYSLAAGGPIVHPEVKGIILTPICAHSLTHRPMVIPDNSKLKINIIDKTNTIHVTLDGQINLKVSHQDTVIITKDTRKSVTLIKNIDRTYYHTLKEKFVHGRRIV